MEWKQEDREFKVTLGYVTRRKGEREEGGGESPKLSTDMMTHTYKTNTQVAETGLPQVLT